MKFTTVEAYLSSHDAPVRDVLEVVRARILAAMPDSDDAISYNIIGLRSRGHFVMYLAGWKSHLSLYPAPTGDADFEAAVAPYRSGASTLKFPLSAPMPLSLIDEVVRLHLAARGLA